jgi:hypothetical protein
VPVPRALLLVLSLAGCVSGDGDVTTTTIPVGAYTGVRSTSFADVRVSATPSPDATVTCEANLVPHLTTVRDDDLLVLGTRGGLAFFPSAPCTVALGTAELEEVRADGTGGIASDGPFDHFRSVVSHSAGELRLERLTGSTVSVEVDGTGSVALALLQADELDVAASGTAPTVVDGATSVLSVVSDAVGDVDASGLDAVDVRVEALGEGDVYVRASGTATVRLSGTGNVVVYGGPELEVVDVGEGEVLAR